MTSRRVYIINVQYHFHNSKERENINVYAVCAYNETCTRAVSL